MARGRGLMGYGSEFQGRPTSPEEHQTTNLGVRSSNLFGRANDIKDLSEICRRCAYYESKVSRW